MVQRLRQRRGFGGDTDGVEHGDRARRCRRRAQRFQLVFVRFGGQTKYDGDFRLADLPQQIAEDGEENILAAQTCGEVIGKLDEQLAAPIFGQMQPDGRGTTRNGGTNIYKIPVPIGACPQDRVGKNDGVALCPCDLCPQRWALYLLVGGAGPDGLATELLIGGHQFLGLGGLHGRALKIIRVEQIHPPHIQRRRHTHPRPTRHQRQGKIQPRIAVVQTTINMCRTDF
jgi:hypothetical protein